MRSVIFQITKNQVSGKNVLNEDTIMQGEGTSYDYCSEIDNEERENNIRTLVNEVMPEGMFEFVSQNAIKYKGGAEEWKKECIKKIQDTAGELDTDNITNWVGPIYKLEKLVKNPLDVDYEFYFDEDGVQNYAEKSYELLRFVSTLEVGTVLYFGGVIAYRF